MELNLQEGQTVDVRVLGISEGGIYTGGDFALTVTPGACADISVYDVLRRRGNATFFLDALWFAAPDILERLMNRTGDLDDTLSVLVPPDEAFRYLNEEDGSALMNLWNDEAGLVNILKYHIVEGVVEREDFAGLTATLQGTSVELTSSGSNGFANDEPITAADLQASNGVAHEIQGVLYLPDTCMTEMMCEDNEECIQGACRVRAPETIWSRVERLEKFSLFKELVLSADNRLDTFLSLESPFFVLNPDVTPEECETRQPPCGITAFLPTNEAFGDLDIPTLLADENIGYRLDHHVLPGLWQSADLNVMGGQTIDSIMGRPIEFAWDIAGFLIDGQPSIAVDVTATNGIVHELSTFLELPAVPAPCDTPILLTLGGAAVAGTTQGLSSFYDSFCGGSGGEVVYEVSAAEYQRVCVSVEATEDQSDPLVYVREAACGNFMEELVCLDDNNYPSDLGARVDFEAIAGESYFVFVDALSEDGNGAYEVGVRSGACENPATASLWETVSGDPQYSEFAAIVQGTSYETLLSNIEVYSMFIPTNEALGSLETEMPALWATMTSPERIEEFVGAHIISGRYALGRLARSNSLTMLNEQTFEVFDGGSGLSLGGRQG